MLMRRPLAYALPLLGALTLGTRVSAHDVQVASPVHLEKSSEERHLPDWFQTLEMPNIPVRMEERVIDYLVYFHDDPRGKERIRTWFERSQMFEGTVRANLRAMQLPEDLLYVTMVESNSDPRVRSRKGALGLWQFVRKTASHFKLTRNRWVDTRIDPDLSTVAAGRYLNELYQRYGTWELALAAYNMGPGALTQAIRKYNTNDYAVLSQIEAGLPYETTYYVARIMACIIVGHNRALFDISDNASEENVSARLEVPGGIYLRTIAQAANVPLQQLRQLNPGLLRLRTPPSEATWVVHIPHHALEPFENRWRGRYRVLETHELTAIKNPVVSYESPRLQRRPKSRSATEALFVAVPEKQFHYSDRIRVFHPVKAPIKAHDLASRYGVLLKELCAWNHIDFRAPLHPGMIVQMFLKELPAEADSAYLLDKDVILSPLGSPEFFDHHEAARKRQRIIYTTKAGDTLRSLARRYELSVRSLSRINRFSRRATLEPGQQLVIYAPKS